MTPSGAQFRFTSGDQEVTVVEVGGGLRTYTARGNDFRRPRPIGDLVVDHAYTGMTGSEVLLGAPHGGRQVRLWWDASYRWVMVFTGDTLDPARRRRGLAVEPMTCAPNAFVTGDGIRVLEPEERWTTTWGIALG